MGEIVIPDDWNGEDYCCFSVMWPNSLQWLAVLNGLVDTAGTGFSYNEATGNVTEAAAAIKQTWEYNFRNEVVIMACNSDIAEALLAIAQSLANGATGNNGCGCVPGVSGGSSGTGMIDNPPSGTEDTPESHEGPPPTGYDSWEQFDQLKCDWANFIYDQIITDVATMSLVAIGTAGVTGLASILVPLLTTPVGWTILATLATVMIAAAATSGFYGFISTHLGSYRNDYICAMVQGDDVSGSISGFGAAVDENIEADSNFNILTGYWANSILKGLATIASFNRMYEKQSLTVPEGECDCDISADCLALTYGFIDDIIASEGYDGALIVHTAADSGGVSGCTDSHIVRIETPCAVSINIVSLGDYTEHGVCDTFYVYDVCDSTLQFNGDTWVDQDLPIGGCFYIVTDGLSNWQINFTNL